MRTGYEPTQLPSGGYYATVDGAILRRHLSDSPRIFLTPQRALKAARVFIDRETDIAWALYEAAQRVTA